MPILYYSQLYAALIVTLYYVFYWRKIPFGQFFNPYSVKILVTGAVVSLVVYSITVFHVAFDMIYTQDYVEQLAFLLCLLYVMPFLCEGDESTLFDRLSEIVIATLCVQACIAVSGFVNESIAAFLIQQQDVYGAVNPGHVEIFRRYNLGAGFFSLPATYGICFMLWMRLYVSDYRTKIFSTYGKYILFALLLIGVILSGRTGFVGLVAALIFLFCTKETLGSKFLFLSKVIGMLLVVVVLASQLVSKSHLTNFQENVMPWAFEFVYKYIDENKLTTSSTEALERMYYELPMDVWMRGTGFCMGVRDSLFKITDAGYMLQIIYGGVFYFLLLVYFQLLFFIEPIRAAWRSRYEKEKNDVFFWVILLIHLFVLHYKGEVIGYNHIIQCVLFVLGYVYLEDKRLNLCLQL
ncbi:hypothetical protein AGMMS49525_11870 [Bacteroidia bacterium]|nr:hypothetical protein AGMMS49525_11870 [Bacteroidia bacterium]